MKPLTLLRSLLFNAAWMGLTVVLALFVGVPIRLFARARALGLARLWARLVLDLARLICGIRLDADGLEHVPTDGPALIASQHRSAYDTLIWAVLLPLPTYVVKQELERVPLFGPLLRPAGQIIVRRDAGAAAIRGLVQDGIAARDAGRQIVIFPEGTRAHPDHPVPLQPGVVALASRLGLPVIPVATDSERRWGRRAFNKQAGAIHVRVMPPIPPGLPRDALTRRIEAAWAEGTQAIAASVDNSVGNRRASLPARARMAPQPDQGERF